MTEENIPPFNDNLLRLQYQEASAERLASLVVLANTKCRDLEAALQDAGVAFQTCPMIDDDHEEEEEVTQSAPPPPPSEEEELSSTILSEAHEGQDSMASNEKLGGVDLAGRWSEFEGLKSASELRRLEEDDEQSSVVDISSIAPMRRGEPSCADDSSRISLMTGREDPHFGEFTRVTEVPERLVTSETRTRAPGLSSRVFETSRPPLAMAAANNKEKQGSRSGFYCIEADDGDCSGGALADTWFATGTNANRHLSLRTHRLGLLPRQHGGPQTSRAAIELNSLNASVAEFPRMHYSEGVSSSNAKPLNRSRLKFGYEPSVSTDVAPGLETYLKEIGSSFTARPNHRTRVNESGENESPSRVRERLLFEMMKVYDDAGVHNDDPTTSFDDSIIN